MIHSRCPIDQLNSWYRSCVNTQYSCFHLPLQISFYICKPFLNFRHLTVCLKWLLYCAVNTNVISCTAHGSVPSTVELSSVQNVWFLFLFPFFLGCVGFGTEYGHVIHSLFLTSMYHFYRLSENFFTKCFAFIEEAQIGLWCQAWFFFSMGFTDYL